MVFIIYFGLPSIKRFQKKEVMVVTSQRVTEGIKVPAITIIPKNPDTSIGWRINSLNFTFPNLIQPFCENTTFGNATIDGCIEENTYSQAETLQDVLLGYTTRKSLLEDEGLVTDDFTHGRAYTLNIAKTIGPDDTTDQLYVAVGYDLNYRIILHDPFYYVVNINPTTFPSILLEIRPNETRSHYYGLALTEMEELDIPEDPCNPDPDYNFQACIKESLSRQEGCRTRWDRWSHQDRPLCRQMDQFR
jgi:hypothetical protein